MRIAYLVSVYPAPSHAFIRREIAALRGRGLSIETFTVRRAPRGELPDHTDRVEFDRTWSILPSSPWALVRWTRSSTASGVRS